MSSWTKSYIAILIAETLAIAGFATSMPIVPLYLQDMGLTDPAQLKYWTGLIQSVSSIALAVFAPIWGSLADSYGRRMMLLRAMFGGAILVGLMAFTVEPWQFLVLRTLQGCVTGTIAAATVLVAGIAPVARVGFALGILQTGVSAGNSIGPLIGGVVSDFLGRRAAFMATGLMLFAAGIIVALGVADDTRKRARGERIVIRLIPDFRPILASPLLLALMSVVFALQVSYFIAGPLLPLYVQELAADPNLIGSTTGIVLGAGAAAAAVAATVVGRISGNLGYARTLFLCLGGGALLYLPQAFVSTPLQLTLWRVAASFFIGGAIPTVNALIASRADTSRQGAIFGISTSISSTGMALGPVIGSVIATAFDYRAVFIASALLLGATVLGLRAAAPRIEASAAPAAETQPRT